MKYSPLTDINRVDRRRGSRVAWEWSPREKALAAVRHAPGQFSGDAADDRQRALPEHALQPRRRARTPTPARELWAFDPKAYEDGQPPNGTGFVHRGVAAWRDGADGNKLRIFINSRYRLICLDAATGRPVDSFGTHGVVRSQQGPRLGDQQDALHEHVAADRLQGSGDPRQRRRRSARLSQRSAGRRPRVRRAHRQAGVVVPHRSRSRASSATTPGAPTRGASPATPTPGRR